MYSRGTTQSEGEIMKHYIKVEQIQAEPGYTLGIPQGEDPTRVTQEMVDDFIINTTSLRLGNHTVLHVELRNGFSLIEESACVDPANYDHALGERLALEKAKKKVWNLLGFLLATARNGVNHA
jgi:hypothetical protein